MQNFSNANLYTIFGDAFNTVVEDYLDRFDTMSIMNITLTFSQTLSPAPALSPAFGSVSGSYEEIYLNYSYDSSTLTAHPFTKAGDISLPTQCQGELNIASLSHALQSLIDYWAMVGLLLDHYLTL